MRPMSAGTVHPRTRPTGGSMATAPTANSATIRCSSAARRRRCWRNRGARPRQRAGRGEPGTSPSTPTSDRTESAVRHRSTTSPPSVPTAGSRARSTRSRPVTGPWPSRSGVVRKFGDDRGGRLAAVDLLLQLLLAVPGAAGDDHDPRLRPARTTRDLASDIRDSALAQFPVVGPQLATSSEPLTGNMLALVVGIVGALWAGMGAAQAARTR